MLSKINKCKLQQLAQDNLLQKIPEKDCPFQDGYLLQRIPESVQSLMAQTENVGGSQHIVTRNTNSTVSGKRRVC